VNVTPIIDAIAELIQDPTSNITAAAIGLAMVVLLIMIVVVALLALVAPGSRSSRSAAPKAKGGRGKRGGAKGASKGDTDAVERPESAPATAAGAVGPRPAPRPAPPGAKPVPRPVHPGARPVSPGAGRPAPQSRAADGPAVPTASAPAEPPKKSSKKRTRRRHRKASAWFIFSLMVGLLFAAAGTLYVSTSANEYCTSVCHGMAEASSTWKGSLHKDVACVRCHEGRFALTAPAGLSSRVRSVYLAASGSATNPRPIPSSRCLECHRDVVEKTLVGPEFVRISHKEIVAAGSDCTDCHAGQGHSEGSLSEGMPACLRCHDDQKASAACPTCHPKGDEASISSPVKKFGSPVLLPARIDCGGCHEQTKCDNCHGIRMPHPDGFATPKQHAKLAAFEKKDVRCAKCHAVNDCVGPCHGGFDAHGSDWKHLHKYSPVNPGKSCGCHDTADFCLLCHDKGIRPLPVPSKSPTQAISQ